MQDPIRHPPLFNDLDAANAEILKLRNMLVIANERTMKAVEKAELTKRSLAGTIRSLQEQLKILKLMKGDPP